ncbi:MAG: hypothetical protein LAT65_20740, partial [Saccharospirillum sp.]|nr:hypothetical protein [Saccharospirillum sp.]
HSDTGCARGEITHRVQPPDAENRTSGGVGGVAGAILLLRPDQGDDTPEGLGRLRRLGYRRSIGMSAKRLGF